MYNTGLIWQLNVIKDSGSFYLFTLPFLVSGFHPCLKIAASPLGIASRFQAGRKVKVKWSMSVKIAFI